MAKFISVQGEPSTYGFVFLLLSASEQWQTALGNSGEDLLSSEGAF